MNTARAFLLTAALLPLCAATPQDREGTVSGTLKVWHPVEIAFEGPEASETDKDPNPFLDYRLQVTLRGPGKELNVPGFFDGDGKGRASGSVWKVRFSLDSPGRWRYTASFRTGKDIAVDLDPDAGKPCSFDGASGSFSVKTRDPDAPGFLKWGRLEYVGGHYLKFRDGGYFVKGGTDSPENFMGYKGFDGVHDNGNLGIIHEYKLHQQDWRPGDPVFQGETTGYDSKGIIGALNYLSSRHVNSIYFLPMNLGGDGQETCPFVGYEKTAFNKTHYDLGRMRQWWMVFNHAQEKGIKLHFVLSETEEANEQWLDEGGFGVERKLFFRELNARFGSVMALKWNLGEESDAFSPDLLKQFAEYIRAVDPYDHPIAVHTLPDNFKDYAAIKGHKCFEATSIQYSLNKAGQFVERWRMESAAAGRPWILDMDENNPAHIGLKHDNHDELRKQVLYAVYFSGGNLEWYCGYHDLPLGGDMKLENFRTREPMWNCMWHARRFMLENLPFWEMEPADDLLVEESDKFGGGQVFAKPGKVYAIYLPDASRSGSFDLRKAPGAFEQSWYNPRNGKFEGKSPIKGGKPINLGPPPNSPGEDWVILISKR